MLCSLTFVTIVAFLFKTIIQCLQKSLPSGICVPVPPFWTALEGDWPTLTEKKFTSTMNGSGSKHPKIQRDIEIYIIIQARGRDCRCQIRPARICSRHASSGQGRHVKFFRSLQHHLMPPTMLGDLQMTLGSYCLRSNRCWNMCLCLLYKHGGAENLPLWQLGESKAVIVV